MKKGNWKIITCDCYKENGASVAPSFLDYVKKLANGSQLFSLFSHAGQALRYTSSKDGQLGGHTVP